MLVVLRLFSLVVLFLAGSALAGEGDWQVAKTSQQVAYTVDKQKWTPVRAGDIVPNNAWISTGPRGRVQLVRGVESIAFQPNTLAGIFTRNEGDRKTNVYQQAGVLDLEIEKRSRPHTSVQTPFLAAVVKGTNFRVSVEKQQARVSVNRGLVQVTSFSSGQRSEVGARQSATVDSARGMSVSGETTAPSVETVAPSTPKVPMMGARPNADAAAAPADPADPAAAPAGFKDSNKSGWSTNRNAASSQSEDDEQESKSKTQGFGWSGKSSATASQSSGGWSGSNKSSTSSASNKATSSSKSTTSSGFGLGSNKSSSGTSSSSKSSSSSGFGSSKSSSSSSSSSKSESGSSSSSKSESSSSSKSSSSGNSSSSSSSGGSSSGGGNSSSGNGNSGSSGNGSSSGNGNSSGKGSWR